MIFLLTIGNVFRMHVHLKKESAKVFLSISKPAKMKSNLFIILFVLCYFGCAPKKEKSPDIWNTKQAVLKNKVHNQLLEYEKEAGWRLLFDGKSLNGWHLYNKRDATKQSAWEVRDGLLYCNPKDENKLAGDLVTDEAFEDYELSFEWKIASRGNSGIFINVQERPEILQTYHSGPEYQLLDSDHMDYDIATKRPGCLYGFLPQENRVEVHSTGQWNNSTIKQKNGTVQFYLNGVLTATEDFNSDRWKTRVSTSNFANHPHFGAHTKGQIALQNWYFEVWFRNMKIREL